MRKANRRAVTLLNVEGKEKKTAKIILQNEHLRFISDMQGCFDVSGEK